jgi:hypothetical protein
MWVWLNAVMNALVDLDRPTVIAHSRQLEKKKGSCPVLEMFTDERRAGGRFCRGAEPVLLVADGVKLGTNAQ